MSQPRVLDVERKAGLRARHVVYYRRNGKRYLDGLWSPTAESARADFLAMAKELGWSVEIERVEERESLA
jgi:hypothetical protein